MLSTPIPGAADDGLKLRKLRLPIQIALDAFRARNQDCRITRSPRHLARGNRMPSYPANRFDDFSNAESASGTKIVNKLVVLTQSVEYQDVGAGEVADVNIIANAGAIWRRIIGSENRDVFAFS